MTSKLERRHDRDARGVEGLTERVYSRAEKRQREKQREQGHQSLRDRIGIRERPPRTLREKCLGIEKEETRQPDFIDALRERRKEREREQRVRHY